MKRRLYIILLIILLIFVCIGSVSASDFSSTNSSNLLAYNSTDNTNILSEDNEYGTFTDLNTFINSSSEGSTINLDKNYKYSPSTDGNYINGTHIYTSITINGNNHVIDGSNIARAFNISSGNVTFINCVFTNCKGIYGGAIYSDDSIASVDNCVFTNNNASVCGGAVYSNSIGSITNSKFVNNIANNYGGSVYVDNGNISYLTNDSFVNCSASLGGAIYNNNGNVGSITNCTFDSLKSYGPAAAIYCNGNISSLINSSISNSSSNSYGMISYSGNFGDIAGCNFTNIRSGSAGGVLYNSRPGIIGSIKDSNFKNISSLMGGAVYGSYTNISSIDNCTFVDINCTAPGSAIYNYNSNIGSITNTVFNNCKTNSVGGAIYTGNISAIINSTFNDTRSTATGGAIYASDEIGSIINTTFTNINGSSSGGAINVYGNISLLDNVTFSNITFNYGPGGAINSGNIGLINDCSFVNISPSSTGGAISVNGNISSINNTKFINTSSGGPGGAIYSGQIGSLYNCTFLNTLSNSTGGAVSVNSIDSVVDCSFTNLSSKYPGGAIFSQSVGSVSNTTFNNLVSYMGAAIYSRIIANISDSVFNNATALNAPGGAIFADNISSILNCIFNNSSSTYMGGAIYSAYINLINNTSFSNNSCLNGSYKLGGAIWSSNISTISNCNFTNNTGSLGGAIYTNCANITNSNFADNMADNGTVYGLNINVDNCNFTNNHANEYGSGLYFVYSNNTVSNSIFSNNQDPSDSTIFNNANLTLNKNTIDNGKFIYNNGTIKSPITVNVANYTCFPGTNLKLITIINDDNGNQIVAGDYNYTVNGATFAHDDIYFNKSYIAPMELGSYPIDVVYGNGTDITYNYGVIDVVSYSVDNVSYGEDVNVIVQVPENATGTVSAEINGEAYTGNVENGISNIVIKGLNASNYSAHLIYNTPGYDPKNVYLNFTVSMINSTVDVSADNISYGKDGIINIKVPSDATGNVTVVVNGVDYSVGVGNGSGVLSVSGLDAGNYTVDVGYNGDNNYYPSVNSTGFSVSKVDSTVNITVKNITRGQDLIIDVTVPSDATGNVTVVVNGVGYSVGISNGSGVLSVSGLDAGNYTVDVGYNGDNNYYPSVISTGFSVSKVDSMVNVTVKNITRGQDLIIDITVPSDATGNVTVVVNGVDYSVGISNGSGVLSVSGLDAGNYTVDVKYNGDNNYYPSVNSSNFTVFSNITNNTNNTGKNTTNNITNNTVNNDNGSKIVDSDDNTSTVKNHVKTSYNTGYPFIALILAIFAILGFGFKDKK
ncbi:Ig-like domain repeat protein [uncultured Methanobrevibacter sp.]|uniref:beta strand repeat-containing protein n=1 Tax=uncultured Methanobrevibacter sp. TaxID=253161 RepID=UPI00258FE3F4|nr:Ig-like domain repeat protein [uncultured Methanobrevibacter sp.]